MRLKLAALLATSALIATPALAGHCPKDMAVIDAALAKKPQLTSAQTTEVTQLRAEGEQLHKAGDHKASVAALEKAMEILGVGH